MAVYASRPKLITDGMFIATAQAIARQVSQDDRDLGMSFPKQSAILQTEITTATRVAEHTFDRDRGSAAVDRPADIRRSIEG